MPRLRRNMLNFDRQICMIIVFTFFGMILFYISAVKVELVSMLFLYSNRKYALELIFNISSSYGDCFPNIVYCIEFY